MDKKEGYLKSQHVALKEIYPEMTRKERRQWVTENVPKQEPQNKSEKEK